MSVELLQSFEILVVNLDRSKDRLAHITNVLKRHSLCFERIKAIDFKDYSSIEEMREKIPNTPPCISQGGQIGCFMSHIMALRMAMQSKKHWTLILEDDVDSNVSFLKYRLSWFLFKNSDNDMIYVNSRGPGGTDAYFVNRKSALKLHALIYKAITPDYDKQCPIDFMFFDVIRSYNLKYLRRPFFHVGEFPQGLDGTRY